MKLQRATAFLTLLYALIAGPASASELLWPGGDYDPAVPSLQQVLGYAPGERISWSHDVRRYFDALAAAAPDRVQVHEYATSWEGRRLFYVVISSPSNMSRLAEIRGATHDLLDPRATDSTAAQRAIENLPAVTWLAYGVHGNEISSTDAAMYTAYHLLASRDDARVQAILEDSVVILAPIQNPDGRDRFIHRFESASGLEPSPDRRSAEQNEPWPSGRTNHYLFDLNRDWFIRTQPETRGHADAVREWLPVVFVDLHEMGSDNTYYFAPEAVPFNPHLTADQRSSLELFGRTNAGWFDRFGIDYFTREVYDAFYPGYGASWPAYYGAVAMTYEQASARGLAVRQYDGNVVAYAETVRNHFLTSMGTAETVAANRELLLRNFYDYQRTAIAEGESGEVRAYVLSSSRDPDGLRRMGRLLAAQGARVERARSDFSACGSSFDSGSLVINLDQPAKRMLRTLLDQHVPMEAGFVAEQERRRDKNLGDEIYDVTAWSLPLLFNVDATACERPVRVAGERVDAKAPPPAAAPAVADVAYLVPWGERAAVRLLSRALRAGVSVKTADEGFVNAGRSYPAGTLIIDVADNDSELHDWLTRWQAETQAQVIAVSDSWVTDGPNFGSNKVQRMSAPRIAMAWDEPTSQYSAGNFRFVVERQFDYPVTPIRLAQLASRDLDGFDVLVLPDVWSGSYSEALGETGVARLRDWVRRGGVLVALSDATRFLADPDADLLPTDREYALQATETAKADADEEPGRAPALELTAEQYAAEIEVRDSEPASMGGAFLRADVDADHWLAAGVASQLHVLARNADSYRPLRLDEGTNVVRFAPADELLASGHLWDTHRRRLALKPLLMTAPLGRGHLVAFTQDPTVRAYQDGLNVLVANALFRAAAHARPQR